MVIPQDSGSILFYLFFLRDEKTEGRERDGYAKSLQRHVEVARILTGNYEATAEEGIYWLESLLVDLKIPRLSVCCSGIRPEHIKGIVDMSAKSSSMQGNPIKLSVEELTTILKAAI